MTGILRRKMRRGARAGDGPPRATGAEYGWRQALPRALRDGLGLVADVDALTLSRRSLTEVLDLPPDRALLALLDGPNDATGLIALSPGLTAGLIEQQTMGAVMAADPPLRRPTRIDAAMVLGVIDRALAGLDDLLAAEEDLVWAGGFRTASFLEDPRPLGLLLEDQPYRVALADLAFGPRPDRAIPRAGGDPPAAGRIGQVLLVLPAEGRGRRPVPRPGAAPPRPASPATPHFGTALTAVVQAADCRLDAVIARLSLPLGQVMALAPGQDLALPGARLDRISVEGIDMQALACGHLGQHRGQRALRLTGLGAQGGAAVPDAAPATPDPPEAEALRPTG